MFTPSGSPLRGGAKRRGPLDDVHDELWAQVLRQEITESEYLLVQGGASAPPVHRLVTHLTAMLPGAEIATIDRDNHLLPLRSPDALARLIVTFSHRYRATASA